jgi:hypothetical protein
MRSRIPLRGRGETCAGALDPDGVLGGDEGGEDGGADGGVEDRDGASDSRCGGRSGSRRGAGWRNLSWGATGAAGTQPNSDSYSRESSTSVPGVAAPRPTSR